MVIDYNIEKSTPNLKKRLAKKLQMTKHQNLRHTNNQEIGKWDDNTLSFYTIKNQRSE